MLEKQQKAQETQPRSLVAEEAQTGTRAVAQVDGPKDVFEAKLRLKELQSGVKSTKEPAHVAAPVETAPVETPEQRALKLEAYKKKREELHKRALVTY